jgi:hypothetical protein
MVQLWRLGVAQMRWLSVLDGGDFLRDGKAERIPLINTDARGRSPLAMGDDSWLTMYY